MSKQRKKVHCTCHGKTGRVNPGPDRQKHAADCPILKRPA